MRPIIDRRGLSLRGNVWRVDLVLDGERVALSTNERDLDAARRWRDAYLAKRGAAAATMPTFAAMAARVIEEDLGHLAPLTQRDRARELGPEGPIVPVLGAKALDAIEVADLRHWWKLAIEGKKLSTKSGRNYMDSIAHVFAFAVEDGIKVASPVRDFRATLKRKSRTQRGRHESAPGRHVKPIEDPAHIDRLLAAARDEGQAAHVACLLGLDGGLRKGETWALTWAGVQWGRSADDPSRALRIEQSASGGGPVGPTRSGRARVVAMSRRLRAALLDLYEARFRPSPSALVLEGVDYMSFQDHAWRRILNAAGLAGITYKDLRDTYASQLVTCGVPIGYVSRQLGHSGIEITSKHYAKWAGGDDYRDPLPRLPGEVPADFLARLPGRDADLRRPSRRRAG